MQCDCTSMRISGLHTSLMLPNTHKDVVCAPLLTIAHLSRRRHCARQEFTPRASLTSKNALIRIFEKTSPTARLMFAKILWSYQYDFFLTVSICSDKTLRHPFGKSAFGSYPESKTAFTRSHRSAQKSHPTDPCGMRL